MITLLLPWYLYVITIVLKTRAFGTRFQYSSNYYSKLLLPWVFHYYHKFPILSVLYYEILIINFVFSLNTSLPKQSTDLLLTTKVQTFFEIKNTSIISSKNTFLPKFRLRSGYINYTLENPVPVRFRSG